MGSAIRRAWQRGVRGPILVFFALTAVGSTATVPAASRDLGFEERVAAQRAIEQVYWLHRVWPADNPAPKPALGAVLSDEAIRAKVEDYLKKSNALERFWRRPIEAVQLQAELDRLSRQTRDPELLREIYAALGNDPALIAETLARPTLVDRLIRNGYAADDRIHGPLRQEVERALAGARSVAEMKALGGEHAERTFVRGDDGAATVERSNPGIVVLNGEEWQQLTEALARQYGRTVEEIPLQRLSGLEEDAERFSVSAVLSLGADRVVVASVTWPKRSFEAWWSEERDRTSAQIEVESAEYELAAPAGPGCADDTWQRRFYVPEARHYATAVWTGTEMIVWGGDAATFPYDVPVDTGGRYNPATDSWTATAEADAPSVRRGHTAVWTGAEMIVWGGTDGVESIGTGGRYDPIADAWTPTSTWVDAPSPRVLHTAVWTGTEMIVWGGSSYGDEVDSGGRYDPTTDSWTPTSTGANVPYPRFSHTAVWTGTEMIVWGGYGTSGVEFGGRYDPTMDSWAPTSIGENAPSTRQDHTAVWTGAEMVIWGGRGLGGPDHATGGRYQPATDSWVATSTGANVPSGRHSHVAVWTGTEMIVWGGVTDSGTVNTGGRYEPATDSWTPTSTGANVPLARGIPVAVWTSTELIVWGGVTNGGTTNTGGRYEPATDSWTPTSSGPNVPAARHSHVAVWTGTELIVWGGLRGVSFLDTGGRYVPSTDSWTSTGANAPSARRDHAAVWTGLEMIVWGGNLTFGDSASNTGARYDPTTDSWVATSTDANVPSPRGNHTAVWTGTEMIVWGGADGNSYVQTGGRYDPMSDSWTPTSTGANVPSARRWHTAVWTGAEMILWGGSGASNLNTGGRYSPTLDAWTATSTGANVPSARGSHTSVWTGAEMIVWGGFSNTGGRYAPLTDSWTATSTGLHVPSNRAGHSAVWTGDEMIVWGGGTYLRSGGRYDPATNTWAGTSTATGAPTVRTAHTAVWTGTEMIVWGGEPLDSNLYSYCAFYCPDPVTSYRDDDDDGYGDPAVSTATCDGSIPAGYAAAGDDCNDADAAVHPAAVESCNEVDDDCDGASDEPFDLDLDSFSTCELPTADCDDGDATVYPGAAELNDGQDNQCPGEPGYGISDEIAGVVVYGPGGELCWSDVSGATLYQVARSPNPSFDPAVIIATVAADDPCVVDDTPPPVGGAWYYLVRAIAPYVGSWGQDSSGTETVPSFEGNAVVDQANLDSTGNLVVNLSQLVGQTSTAGLAGQLVGIEIAPLLDNLEPADVLFLDVRVLGTPQSGTAMITASGFPPGAGTVPAPLTLDGTGPGYFDLAPLGITVEPGQTVEFVLRPGWASSAKRCRAGTNEHVYGAGAGTVNGNPGFDFDLAFKTLVRSN